MIYYNSPPREGGRMGKGGGRNTATGATRLPDPIVPDVDPDMVPLRILTRGKNVGGMRMWRSEMCSKLDITEHEIVLATLKGWSGEEKSTVTVYTTIASIVERFHQAVKITTLREIGGPSCPRTHVDALFNDPEIGNGLCWPRRPLVTNVPYTSLNRNPRKLSQDYRFPHGQHFYHQNNEIPILKADSRDRLRSANPDGLRL